jgi:hypothetical protein
MMRKGGYLINASRGTVVDIDEQSQAPSPVQQMTTGQNQ